MIGVEEEAVDEIAASTSLDARLERFYSVRINRMSPSDAVDLGRPCSSLFE